MIIPATLIINMGDFTTPHTFFVVAIIELVIQFSNAFMQLFCHPVILKYLFLTFRYDDHFLLQCLNNNTMDFKIILLFTPHPTQKNNKKQQQQKTINPPPPPKKKKPTTTFIFHTMLFGVITCRFLLFNKFCGPLVMSQISAVALWIYKKYLDCLAK